MDLEIDFGAVVIPMEFVQKWKEAKNLYAILQRDRHRALSAAKNSSERLEIIDILNEYFEQHDSYFEVAREELLDDEAGEGCRTLNALKSEMNETREILSCLPGLKAPFVVESERINGTICSIVYQMEPVTEEQAELECSRDETITRIDGWEGQTWIARPAKRADTRIGRRG